MNSELKLKEQSFHKKKNNKNKMKWSTKINKNNKNKKLQMNL